MNPSRRWLELRAGRPRALARAGSVLLVSVALVMSACSPEATRTRGGGLGADVANRDYPLPQLHGDWHGTYQTPKVGRAIQQ